MNRAFVAETKGETNRNQRTVFKMLGYIYIFFENVSNANIQGNISSSASTSSMSSYFRTQYF